MRKIIEARMDVSQLFSSPELLHTMIRYSGGVLRDLFLMIQEAADNALDFGRAAIEEAPTGRPHLTASSATTTAT
ncbi:MAG: hypothetical protein GVY26_14675 [Bacteroidetes bacterium]|nr:hypothetical protein [Bacteroidota bacterium]